MEHPLFPANTDAAELLVKLRAFKSDYFPLHQQRFQDLVAQGQHPKTLFIGCSDSRLVPYTLTGTGPGELFLVRNVGAFVPPYDGSQGHHGTAAAIEFAVLSLEISRIIVCGHSHCGAIKAMYGEVPAEAHNLQRWLDLGRGAVLPVQPCAEALRRTEQRAVVLQLGRLMEFPMVRSRVLAGKISLHGWHYVIEDGEVNVFDVATGHFVAASATTHGTADPRAAPYVEHDGQVIGD